jgi:prophage maintenance system killer protein
MRICKLTEHDIVCLHAHYVLEYHGKVDAEISNRSDLHLAVARAEAASDLDHCAAALLVNLARGNAFRFGNCATAIMSATTLYPLNGRLLVADPRVDDLDEPKAELKPALDAPASGSSSAREVSSFHALVRLARQGKIDESGAAGWLRQYSRRLEGPYLY